MEYTWDDQVPEEKRVHTFARTVMACAAHAALANKPEHHTAVDAENRLKNYVAELVSPGNAGAVKYSFDASRKLTVEAPVSLQKSEKDTIQFQMNLMHGSGKVLIL